MSNNTESYVFNVFTHWLSEWFVLSALTTDNAQVQPWPSDYTTIKLTTFTNTAIYLPVPTHQPVQKGPASLPKAFPALARSINDANVQ